MGWLIVPAEETVYVYHLDQLMAVYDLVDDAPDTALPVPKLAEQFSLSIGELFGWLSL